MSASKALAPDKEPLLPVDKTAERPLWIVLIIMAFLASLALLSARIGERNYRGLQSQLAGTATVQLTDVTADNRLETAEKALAIIRTAAPDTKAVRVSDADALSLIEPWMGGSPENGLPQGIALPVLISLSGITPEQRQSLRREFDSAALPAVIDDHSKWSGDMTRAARAFSIGSWLILLLTVFAGMAASVFATQSAMSAQRKTVSVFAQVGAPDKFIIKLFVARAIKVGAISGALGALGSAAFLLVYRLLRGKAESGIMPDLSPTLGDAGMLIAVCAVFAVICACAAGFTAKHMLQNTRLYT